MTGTRRRGAELEAALLDAAWSELADNGYGSFTMDAVAARAGTSRPVLYRRWSDKQQLVRAAVLYAIDRDDVPVPNTGSLRGDTIALLKHANKSRLQLAAVMTVHLGGYYEETGTSPADLRQTLLAERPSLAQTVIDHAIARGEIPDRPISYRIAALPYTLVQQEFLMTLKRVPTAVIEEIVDTIYLPLVMPAK